MMRDYKIEMQITPQREKEIWAFHAGTKAAATASARDLLAGLREAHHRARVWLDGKHVHMNKEE